uniref:Polycystin cation channel PKD1/PKD2 domain-containing protein n=1 Tax=Meloidogyne incognita TaxID=6306 RepID=A0A914MV01_MELIC
MYYNDSSHSAVDLSDGLFINFNERLGQLSSELRDVGVRLRRHLQFFFMNPLDKYRIRRQFPFKLVLQILKAIFVTTQLVLFAELRISHVDFLDETVTVMRHKFLRDWGPERDTIAYPPAAGKYSVFTSDQIVEHFAHIIKAYYSIQNDSFAAFSYDTITPQIEHWQPLHDEDENNTNSTNLQKRIVFSAIPPLQLCIQRIADVIIENSTYIFDISEVNECFTLNFTHNEVRDIKSNPYTVRNLLAKRNITFTGEDALIISQAIVKFNLRTIHFSPLQNDQKPECYKIDIKIIFDNSRHTGQIKIKLNANIRFFLIFLFNIFSYVNLCNGRVLHVNSIGFDTAFIAIIDLLVLIMCVASVILCLRALVRAHLLKNTTSEFFEKAFKRRLPISDQWEFFNLWYGMIVVNDILIIIGTISKATIEFRDFDSDLFTLTGVVLGIGALLVYIGLLRYFGFFSQYNILVLTLKKSLPSILRFMVCAIILYSGFLIAGWVVIGPYSMKFRTLAQSSEALFSLLNGDDMFATFYTISDANAAIKLFGTIYIYAFVSLFIYVVLSLFIAIIMDAYEVVKNRYNQGMDLERSILQEFLASEDMPDVNTPEAREIFATDQLLQLESGWFLRDFSRFFFSIFRRLQGRYNPTTSSPRHLSAANNGGPFFDYRSFENTSHDGISITEEQPANIFNQRQQTGFGTDSPENDALNLSNVNRNSQLNNLSGGSQHLHHSDNLRMNQYNNLSLE